MNNKIVEFMRDQFFMPDFVPSKSRFDLVLNQFRENGYSKLLVKGKRNIRMNFYKIILDCPNPFKIGDIVKRYHTTERNVWERLYDFMECGVVVKRKKNFYAKKNELKWLIEKIGGENNDKLS